MIRVDDSKSEILLTFGQILCTGLTDVWGLRRDGNQKRAKEKDYQLLTIKHSVV